MTCVGGSEVDPDGVCVEHGETACVVGEMRGPAPAGAFYDELADWSECDTDEDVRL